MIELIKNDWYPTMEMTRYIMAEEFDQYIALPENADRLFELIGGEIVEVPSNPFSSKIAMLIGAAILWFLQQHQKLGHVTGEAGGYMVSGERYAPDVAYISKERIAELPQQGYCPLPPELAVEVISPGNKAEQITIKVANYLAAGTVVWVVYPEKQEVDVFQPGKPAQRVRSDGTLDGGDVLPGFQLPVKMIFPESTS